MFDGLWDREKFKPDGWFEEITKDKKWSRKEQFPDDWITPEEFHFCHTCGMKLLSLNQQVCAHCLYRNQTTTPQLEQTKSQCNETHERLKTQRIELAYQRKIMALVAQKSMKNTDGALFWT